MVKYVITQPKKNQEYTVWARFGYLRFMGSAINFVSVLIWFSSCQDNGSRSFPFPSLIFGSTVPNLTQRKIVQIKMNHNEKIQENADLHCCHNCTSIVRVHPVHVLNVEQQVVADLWIKPMDWATSPHTGC